MLINEKETNYHYINDLFFALILTLIPPTEAYFCYYVIIERIL